MMFKGEEEVGWILDNMLGMKRLLELFVNPFFFLGREPRKSPRFDSRKNKTKFLRVFPPSKTGAIF